MSFLYAKSAKAMTMARARRMWAAQQPLTTFCRHGLASSNSPKAGKVGGWRKTAPAQQAYCAAADLAFMNKAAKKNPPGLCSRLDLGRHPTNLTLLLALILISALIS